MGKSILIGVIMGGLISWLLGFTIFTGIIIGAIVGGMLYTILAKKNQTAEETQNKFDDNTLQLREEELDIKKERVQTGEVKIHKEVVEEPKTITVPIRREEMVIEAGSDEVYRIPVKEEEIEINKHPVKVAEVSVSKRQIEEIQQVKETIKKETAELEVKGVADVQEDNKKHHPHKK
ncbi:YsnF/AvaK domain-containing protein [Alkalihalobacterium alkalinitrilicum]|uniref:YsnF/AvaK domain-containing protein n=1 Tax=Alkalihalobacterium alkalinitrilicum TaxID=427920 RepID=UPI0009954AD0|nr:YsnF/AvaK domain-containing protein [Alkalihalobacterium alkalinitrilicum]